LRFLFFIIISISYSFSNNCDTGYVELWEVCYEIETTTKLALEYNHLSGTIPSDIGKLKNLTYLALFNNKLIGEIPKEIGNLTKLNYLDLFNNKLEGEIPKEIGNLINLTFLSLSSNQLSGTIPLEINKLQNLTHLNLNDNNLEGEISIKLDLLEELNLSNNRLDKITDAICGIIDKKKLKYCNLSYNNLCPNNFNTGYPKCILNILEKVKR